MGFLEKSFNFLYEIDDSTAVLKVSATHAAHRVIIPFTPNEVEVMNKSQLQEKLQSHVLNVQDFILSVAKCTDPQIPLAHFRIDQAAQPNSLWECQNLISLLNS